MRIRQLAAFRLLSVVLLCLALPVWVGAADAAAPPLDAARTQLQTTSFSLELRRGKQGQIGYLYGMDMTAGREGATVKLECTEACGGIRLRDKSLSKPLDRNGQTTIAYSKPVRISRKTRLTVTVTAPGKLSWTAVYSFKPSTTKRRSLAVVSRSEAYGARSPWPWVQPEPGSPAAKPVTLTVDNRVTSGVGMVEDLTPLRLTTRPTIGCGLKGCNIPGTERVSNQVYQSAVCQITGDVYTNGNYTDPADDSNPERFTSTRYYGVQLENGVSGFVSEVWIVSSQRGGLGLPGCKKTW